MTKENWLCRVGGAASGLLMTIPHLYPAAVPMQAVALAPLLFLGVGSRVRGRSMLLAGMYMGLAYTVPQLVALRMPAPIALTLLLYLTVLFIVFGWVSAKLLRRSAIMGAFAVGAFLVVLDWVNFTAIPIWGEAQSFSRPWSRYSPFILFVSFTGITGIIFLLGTLQALAVNFVIRPTLRRRLFAVAAVVILVFMTANIVVQCRRQVGRLKVAAVGWTSKAAMACGEIYSPKGFDVLFARPVAQAASQGARLIGSPEMGFYIPADQRQQWLRQLEQVARRHNVFLGIGYFNLGERENRLLFMNTEGMVIAEYTKTYLTAFEDSRKGDGQLRMFDIEGVRVGGMVCQDDNFTRLSREYGRKQVAVVAVPTLDWSTVKDAHLQSSIHRAIESRYAIVRPALNGISAIVSPTGEVLARKDHFLQGPGAIVAEVPVYASRTLFSLVGHWLVLASTVFLVIYAGWNFVLPRFKKRRPTSTKSVRRVTLLWIVICCAALIAAFIVGISGNPPGLALCYVAAISLVLAFVHTWRKVKYFLILTGASLAGFAVFVVLHNVFYGLGQMAAGIIVLSQLLEFLHAAFFVTATLVCPAGFVIGAVGSVVTALTYFKKRRTLDRLV